MEIHQVRYFLALSRSLNFTRAAEECHVTQPALSRGIIQLEAEFGGDLVRREGRLTHLTSLGQTVLPALQECYEASIRAKSLASSFLKEGHAPLNLVLSRSIDLEVVSPILTEIAHAFPKIEIGISRGPAHDIAEKLKSGAVDLAIAGTLADDWERFEAKRLFRQRYAILIDKRQGPAKGSLPLSALDGKRLLACSHCAMTERVIDLLRDDAGTSVIRHEVPQLDDVAGLVRAGFGFGVMPVDRPIGDDLAFVDLEDVELSRWINAITVAGRPRLPAVSALMALLRTARWPQKQEAAI